MAMTPEEFKHQLLELERLILDAVAYFSLWRSLNIEDQEKVDAMNRYRGLFLPARNASLGMALLQIAKVFDRDTRTVSLRNLLREAIQNPESLVPNVSYDELEKVAGQMNSIRSQLRRLNRHRNQRLAHHDSNPKGDSSVLFGETRDLLDTVGSMYNVLRFGNDRSSTAFDMIARDPERHTAGVVELAVEEMKRVRMGQPPSV